MWPGSDLLTTKVGGGENGRNEGMRRSSVWERQTVDFVCQELTTLWVARLDDSTELKVTDPKEQQGDVEEKEAEDKKRRERVDCGRRGAGC